MTAVAAARILVLGCPGSGKTTLARALAARTGLPLHHLDDEYWGADWSRPTPQQWQLRQRQLAAEPAWIIEGNYRPTIALRAARAQLVVVVDTPATVCLLRVLRRARQIRRGRHDLLPARVRPGATGAGPVRATHDLAALIGKILRYARRDWWPVLDLARTDPAATLVVAVDPTYPAGRLIRLRERCRRRRISAVIVPSAAVSDLVGAARRPRREAEQQ
jgi:hypothetical protein